MADMLRWPESIFISMAMICHPAFAQTVHHDRIDLTIIHQTIEHFSASDAWTMQKIGSKQGVGVRAL
jgi:hypothetical protein